jgi:hypothetical protein
LFSPVLPFVGVELRESSSFFHDQSQFPQAARPSTFALASADPYALRHAVARVLPLSEEWVKACGLHRCSCCFIVIQLFICRRHLLFS